MSRIFMGRGDRSEAEAFRLHMLLNRAIELIDVIQQPCHCGLEDCPFPEECRKVNAEVDDIAAELVTKLVNEPQFIMERGKPERTQAIEKMLESEERGARFSRAQYTVHRLAEEKLDEDDRFAAVSELVRLLLGNDYVVKDIRDF